MKNTCVYIILSSIIMLHSGCGVPENLTKPMPFCTPGGTDYTPYKLVYYSDAHQDWPGLETYNLAQYEFNRAHIQLRDYEGNIQFYSTYYNVANSAWKGDDDDRATQPAPDPCPCAANQRNDDGYEDIVINNNIMADRTALLQNGERARILFYGQGWHQNTDYNIDNNDMIAGREIPVIIPDVGVRGVAIVFVDDLHRARCRLNQKYKWLRFNLAKAAIHELAHSALIPTGVAPNDAFTHHTVHDGEWSNCCALKDNGDEPFPLECLNESIGLCCGHIYNIYLKRNNSAFY